MFGLQRRINKKLFFKFSKKKYQFNFNEKEQSIIFLNKELKDIKIIFLKTGIKTGTGGRLLKTKKRFSKNDNFLFVYGDGLYNVNIQKLIKQHLETKKIATMTITRPKNRFGLAHSNGKKLVSFNEKKTIDRNSNWINAGVFILNYQVFNYIKNFSTFFENEPVQRLIKKSEINVFKHSGFWACMDTLKDKIELNKIYKKKPLWVKS